MGRKLLARASLAILTTFLFWEFAFLKKTDAQEGSFPSHVQTKTVDSGNIHIDRIYGSMIGPMKMKRFKITDQPKEELIWLTSAKINTVDKQDNAISDKYLCHINLDVKVKAQVFDQQNNIMRVVDTGKNFMDLTQGLPEIEFPRGFAIPFLTTDWIVFHAMALNNQPVQEPFDIKFKANFNYVYDHDLEGPTKALGMSFSNVFVPALHPNCPPHFMGEVQYECGVYRADESGKEMNLHWSVPPGRHTYRHSPDNGVNIPFNTTVHYIAMHVHPYAESMELVDLTTNETIFKGNVRHYPNNEDIEKLDVYSSEQGIALYRDHKYEIISVYNNITEKDIDAMAVLYVYYWDKEFDKNIDRDKLVEGLF